MIAATLTAMLLSTGYYTTDEARGLFGQASEAYYRKDYAGAKEGLQKLVEHGFAGPDVYYNLGTTELALGQLGEAVLHLERAKKSGGGAADIEANLAVVRARQVDQVSAAQGEPFLSRIAAGTPERWVSWGFLVSWIAGFALLLSARRVRGVARALAGIACGVAFLAALTLGVALLAHIHESRTVTEAVVLAPQQKVREFPKEFATVLFEVHAGLKVRVLETEASFAKIRLANGLEGWTEKEGLGEI